VEVDRFTDALPDPAVDAVVVTGPAARRPLWRARQPPPGWAPEHCSVHYGRLSAGDYGYLVAVPAVAALCRCARRRGIDGRMRSMSEATQKYSITLPRDIAEAARARGGPSGLSAYVAAAVARQIERDNLNDLIKVAEAEHGPITDEEVQAKRDTLLRAREQQQGTSDPSAA
jgi:hypothetical protein